MIDINDLDIFLTGKIGITVVHVVGNTCTKIFFFQNLEVKDVTNECSLPMCQVLYLVPFFTSKMSLSWLLRVISYRYKSHLHSSKISGGCAFSFTRYDSEQFIVNN